ncbi:MAG: DsbA family protein [Longimicrobiales bacterium]|nr:DsbA family protein [Longimicrobiales bacterium]
MTSSRPTLFYDFVDPLSYLLVLELAQVEELEDDDLAWHPLELRPPTEPLVTLDDPAVAQRWEEARANAGKKAATFDPPRLVPWTRKAHELVLYAAEHDREHGVRRRIFEAYMTESADIGRVDVLVTLAVEMGLDRTESKAVLDVDRHEADVARLRDEALAGGVTSLPTLVAGDRRLEGFHNRDRIGTLLGT